MCVCVYVCMYIRMCVCVYMYVCMHVHMHTQTRTHAHTHTHTLSLFHTDRHKYSRFTSPCLDKVWVGKLGSIENWRQHTLLALAQV